MRMENTVLLSKRIYIVKLHVVSVRDHKVQAMNHTTPKDQRSWVNVSP